MSDCHPSICPSPSPVPSLSQKAPQCVPSVIGFLAKESRCIPSFSVESVWLTTCFF